MIEKFTPKELNMLSVITITFNNYPELKETLDSISAQDIQSIVVNGGNCKETLSFLTMFKGVCLSEKDQGIADAFNKGFALSSGNYVTYLNSGDRLIGKDYYRFAQKFLEENSGFDFVYADLCFVDQYAGELRIKSNNPTPSMPFLHPTLIVRRSIIEKLGLFDSQFKIAMDLDFAYRVINSGAKGYYLPEMVVRMDGRGVSSTKFSATYFETLKVVMKNKDYSFRSLLFFVKNGILLVFKLLLFTFQGERFLGWYRKRKYRIT